MGESFQQRHERAKRQFLNQLDDVDWILVTDYVNWTTPITVQCPAGHELDIVPKSFCGTCDQCNPRRPYTGATRSEIQFGDTGVRRPAAYWRHGF